MIEFAKYLNICWIIKFLFALKNQSGNIIISLIDPVACNKTDLLFLSKAAQINNAPDNLKQSLLVTPCVYAQQKPHLAAGFVLP